MNLRKLWRSRRCWLFTAILVGPVFFYQASYITVRWVLASNWCNNDEPCGWLADLRARVFAPIEALETRHPDYLMFNNNLVAVLHGQPPDHYLTAEELENVRAQQERRRKAWQDYARTNPQPPELQLSDEIRIRYGLPPRNTNGDAKR